MPICDMCQSPKPIIENNVEAEVIKEINLNEVEKEMQRRDQDRFEKILGDLREEIQY